MEVSTKSIRYFFHCSSFGVAELLFKTEIKYNISDEYGGVQMDEEPHLMLILSSLVFKLSHLLAFTIFFASFPKYLSSLIS